MLLWWMLALAGALGAVARHLIATAMPPAAAGALPIGVMVVNVLGCAAFGFVLRLGGSGGWIGPQTQVVLLVGFLGAFTTFSTYVSDLVDLVRAGRLGLAAVQFAGHNVLGVLGLLVGTWLAGRLSPGP